MAVPPGIVTSNEIWQEAPAPIVPPVRIAFDAPVLLYVPPHPLFGVDAIVVPEIKASRSSEKATLDAALFRSVFCRSKVIVVVPPALTGLAPRDFVI